VLGLVRIVHKRTVVRGLGVQQLHLPALLANELPSNDRSKRAESKEEHEAQDDGGKR